MKIKTKDLTGAALDWAVAKCGNKNGVLHDDGITRCIVIAAPSGVYKGRYIPTVNWVQGGPIIEREKIGLSQITRESGELVWVASAFSVKRWGYGPTPLIAAMRCYCSFKLGNEVDVPEELM